MEVLKFKIYTFDRFKLDLAVTKVDVMISIIVAPILENVRNCVSGTSEILQRVLERIGPQWQDQVKNIGWKSK